MGLSLERLKQLVEFLTEHRVAEYRDDLTHVVLDESAFGANLPELPEGYMYMAVPVGTPLTAESFPDDGRKVAERRVGPDDQTPEPKSIYDNPLLYPDGKVPQLDDEDGD